MHHEFRDTELEAARQKIRDLEHALTVARKAADLAHESAARAWRVAFVPSVKLRENL